jgi:FlaA1/EpsC-like NDP-sugar epimerase
MNTHDALHSFDIHKDLIGRNDERADHQQHANNLPSSSKRILLTGGAGFMYDLITLV